MNKIKMLKPVYSRAVCGLCLLFAHILYSVVATAASAEPSLNVGIQSDQPSVSVSTAEGDVIIQRIQDQESKLSGEFSKTSRPCPPFCIQAMQVAPGVTTVGELELLDALKATDTVVIDSRTIEWYLEGTIPGAVHIAYTELASRLDELGCTSNDGQWNCRDAVKAVLFCNGPWCGQSPTAIRAMLREGYPAERIFYYRGGMQLWNILGLTVVEGDF